MGGCAASINKTFTTALAGGEKRPPLVAGATTFAPLFRGALWVLSSGVNLSFLN